MKDKFKNYCLFYLLYYISIGVFSPYLNIYYERLGFSGSQIGNINSISLLASMFVAPLWGIVADKTKKHKLVLSIAMGASCGAIFIWSLQRNFASVLVTAVFLQICRCNIGSLSDSMSVKFCNEHGYDFSVIRSLGSFGYVFGSFFLGNVATYFGFSGPFVYIFLICSAIGVISIMNFDDDESDVESHEDVHEKGELLKILKNGDFIYALLLMILASAVIDVVCGFCGNHLVMTLGKSDSYIGIATLAMVAPEVFIVMKAQKLFDKVGYRNLYLIGCGTQTIRLLVYAFVPNAMIFLLVSAFHGFCIAAICVGNVNYLYRCIDRKLLATGMSIYNVGYILSSALFNQLFGSIYETSGSGSMFFVAAVLSFISFLMVLFSKRLSIMDQKGD